MCTACRSHSTHAISGSWLQLPTHLSGHRAQCSYATRHIPHAMLCALLWCCEHHVLLMMPCLRSIFAGLDCFEELDRVFKHMAEFERMLRTLDNIASFQLPCIPSFQPYCISRQHCPQPARCAWVCSCCGSCTWRQIMMCESCPLLHMASRRIQRPSNACRRPHSQS